jgi:serine acetyltransferase
VSLPARIFRSASIAGGLLLPHANGIVIHGGSLAPNCLMFQQVTLGTLAALVAHHK